MTMVQSSICDVWVGSELGVLKSVDLQKGNFENYGDLKSLDKSQAICAMAKIQSVDGNRIFLGCRDGSAKVFNISTSEFSSPLCCGLSSVCGVVALPDESILTCTENGLLKQWKESECELEKNIGSNIQTMVHNSSHTLIAAGGQENDLKIWEVGNMEKPLFTAKNVRNDFLNLRVPVCVSAIEFFKGSDNEVVIGTGNHTIRTYDTRVKRRPVLDVEYHEHPITAISLTRENKTVIVGNSTGYMAEIDIRTGKQVGGFKGICGSIRDISCHVSQPYVVACGLDRFLKVYDLATRKLEKKIYLKSNLNCMLLTDKEVELSESSDSRKRSKEEADNENAADPDEEDQNIWESMEVIKEKRKKKNEHVDG